MSSADKRYKQHKRTKVADGDVHFRFTDFLPGVYYVVSSVTWRAPTDIAFQCESGLAIHQGGLVVRKVEVEKGAVTEAMFRR